MTIMVVAEQTCSGRVLLNLVSALGTVQVVLPEERSRRCDQHLCCKAECVYVKGVQSLSCSTSIHPSASPTCYHITAEAKRKSK